MYIRRVARSPLDLSGVQGHRLHPSKHLFSPEALISVVQVVILVDPGGWHYRRCLSIYSYKLWTQNMSLLNRLSRIQTHAGSQLNIKSWHTAMVLFTVISNIHKCRDSSHHPTASSYICSSNWNVSYEQSLYLNISKFEALQNIQTVKSSTSTEFFS